MDPHCWGGGGGGLRRCSGPGTEGVLTSMRRRRDIWKQMERSGAAMSKKGSVCGLMGLASAATQGTLRRKNKGLKPVPAQLGSTEGPSLPVSSVNLTSGRRGNQETATLKVAYFLFGLFCYLLTSPSRLPGLWPPRRTNEPSLLFHLGVNLRAQCCSVWNWQHWGWLHAY